MQQVGANEERTLCQTSKQVTSIHEKTKHLCSHTQFLRVHGGVALEYIIRKRTNNDNDGTVNGSLFDMNLKV